MCITSYPVQIDVTLDKKKTRFGKNYLWDTRIRQCM